MIEIPIQNQAGEAVGHLQVDEATLGGEVRPDLLKQAYVRYHANRRQGSANGRSRGEVNFSTRKLYRQKGTGNARRGPAGTNLMRKGGQTFAKKPKSWRMGMPDKMRRLANRNALLAKLIDGEVKVLDQLKFDKPNTGQFATLLEALEIDRTCLVALGSTQGPAARSAINLEKVTLIRGDQINAFDLLNHHYLLVEKDALEQWLARPIASVRKSDEEAA
jgi:large subunit ribosomal protein L4